jgi:uncharacterized protein
MCPTTHSQCVIRRRSALGRPILVSVPSAVVDSPRSVAASLATLTTTRAMRLSARVGLMVAGSLLIAVGVATTLWLELGAGAIDVFIGALRIRTGLPLGLTVWVVVAGFVAASWALGRRPGPGTVLSPLIAGPAMQVAVTLLGHHDVPGPFIVRVSVLLVAVGVVGVGAGAVIVARFGAGPVELLATAASHRTGRPEHRTRMVLELSCLAVGAALGGPVGVGTVLVALAIGPAVAIGQRLVTGAVTASSLVVTPAVSPHA